MTPRGLTVCLVALAIASLRAMSLADVLPAAEQTAPPVGGDLRHLTFTATAPVPAVLVSPADGGYGGAATPILVSTGAGAGVELSVNGTVIDATHLGKREVVTATGETRYTYFGVGLVPGPNVIVLTPLGANGARFASSHYTIYGRGPAVSLRMDLSGRLIADGRTTRTLRVVGVDRWGHPAMSGVGLDVVVRSGDVTLSTANPAAAAAAAAAGPPPVGGPPPAIAGSAALPGVRTAGIVAQTQPVAVAAPAGPVPSLVSPEITSSAPPSGFASQNTNPELGVSGIGEFKAITDVDGGANVPITPGLRSGDAVIDVFFNDRANSLTERLYVWPYVRHPIVTGLVTGGVGAVPGDPGTDATAAYEANSRAGRIAFYGAGQIAPTMNAAVAYDTAGVLDESSTLGLGAFNEDPNARPYLTYGDASIRRDDALSTTHLFAHVDDGQSSIGYGEFEAKTGDDGANSLGGFDLLMNGTRLDLGNSIGKVELFHATAGVSYGRQVIAPNGLATSGYELHPGIVVGSDTLTLVSIDRHLGYIVSETGLTRNVDYVIDYGTGLIRFINPPQAFDASFNPQQILVQYEYLGGGGAVANGGRVSATVGALKFGAGYADDSTGSGDVTLFNQSVSGSIGNGKFSLEHLSTNGGIGNEIPAAGEPVNPAQTTSGDAYRASLNGGLGSLQYQTLYQSTSQGFNDPFGGLTTPGLTSARATLTKPIPSGDLSLTFDSELNSLYGAKSSDSSVSLRVHKTIGKKLKTTAAISHQIESNNGVMASTAYLGSGQAIDAVAATVPTPAPVVASSTTAASVGGVTQAELGATYAFSPAISASVDRISNIGGEALAALATPAQTTAQITAALGKGSAAYFRELWTDAATQTFALASQGLASGASSTHVTQIGIDRQIGTRTTIDTQYSVENAGNGTDVYAAIGVKQRVVATKSFTGDVTLQHALAEGQGATGFDVYGVTLSYDRGTPFRATTSYQLRTGETPGSTFALGAIGYLGSGLSLVSAINDSRSVGIDVEDERVGLAFRPQNDDLSSVLLGYDHLVGVGQVEGEQTDVASLDAVRRVTSSTEVTGRLAYQIDGDQYYPAHSALAGLRVVQKVAHRFDVAGEVRASGVSGVSQSSVAGYAFESGYRVGDLFRFAAGYNFSQTPDLSLAAPPRRKGVYVTATSLVQSLFGFGRDR